MELLVGFWNKLCKDGERTQINYRKQDRIYRDRAYEILVMQPYSFLRVSPGEWSRDFGVGEDEVLMMCVFFLKFKIQ